VVVVGGGVAGLAAALYAAPMAVVMLAKGPWSRTGSSVLAQGGIAIALGDDDSPEHHADDTLLVGGGLSDPAVARSVTSEGPRRFAELLRLGVRFDRADGRVALGREAAHSRRRVAHAAGDATGAEMVRALAREAHSLTRVRAVPETIVLDLVLDGPRVVGVLALEGSGATTLWVARAVVLATGGIGQLWSHTTNPLGSTGDGLAMAARAGARLANLEMMQFHPTALADGSNPMPLLTEALRGEGARLVDRRGCRVMEGVHADLDLAPRDVVARAIWRCGREGREVLLDATSIGRRFDERFPTVLGLCLERGLDPRREPVPVTPAAHYHMGGVVVDREGRTSLPGLWACGEVASTGLHGANRLASNSLLEALVYGARVGEAVSGRPDDAPHPARAAEALRQQGIEVAERSRLADEDPSWTRRLREVMWDGVGLERSANGLARAAHELDRLTAELDGETGEAASAVAVAQMVTRAAAARTESRGAHFRTDFPFAEPAWRQDLEWLGVRRQEPRPLVSPGAAFG
jgi:L-aspartate oxidase